MKQMTLVNGLVGVALALACATVLAATTSAGDDDGLLAADSRALRSHIDAPGADPSRIALAPRRTYSSSKYERFDYRSPMTQIVFKLRDDVPYALREGLVVFSGGIGEQSLREDAGEINRMLKEHRWRLVPLLRVPREVLDSARTQAERYWRERMPDIGSYLVILLPARSDPEVVRAAVKSLARMSIVEVAYPQGPALPPGPASLAAPSSMGDDPDTCLAEPLPPGTPNWRPVQQYLDPAPMGIDVDAAHAQPGGRGERIRVHDVEAAFHPHAEFPPLAYIEGDWNDYQIPVPNIQGDISPMDYGHHGTKVLGILASRDDGMGTLGIVPEAEIGFHSIWDQSLGIWMDAFDQMTYEWSYERVAEQIFIAAWYAKAGVVLLELQRTGPAENCECGKGACKALPVEWWDDTFDVIRYVTAQQVVVVEAAGNGSRNLSSDALGGTFAASKERDSGAILVGGSLAGSERIPFCAIEPMNGRANYGERIDVHSWSEAVFTTTSPGCHDFTTDEAQLFGGTSSAAAIVAGAAAALQSIHRELYSTSMTPHELRCVLRATGTPQMPGTEQYPIGPQPDLAAAIEEIKSLPITKCEGDPFYQVD